MEMTMAFAFDTLGYTKRLQDAGVALPQAEAAMDFIMAELVTKNDLLLTITDLTVRLDNVVSNLNLRIDNAVLQLTLRFGAMVAAGVAALAILDASSTRNPAFNLEIRRARRSHRRVFRCAQTPVHSGLRLPRGATSW
jgi:hypothetical protein